MTVDLIYSQPVEYSVPANSNLSVRFTRLFRSTQMQLERNVDGVSFFRLTLLQKNIFQLNKMVNMSKLLFVILIKLIKTNSLSLKNQQMQRND